MAKAWGAATAAPQVNPLNVAKTPGSDASAPELLLSQRRGYSYGPSITRYVVNTLVPRERLGGGVKGSPVSGSMHVWNPSLTG